MAREGTASFQESYGQGPKARDKNREKERSEVKLPTRRAGSFPEKNEISIQIVPLYPAHRAGLAGHAPVTLEEGELCRRPSSSPPTMRAPGSRKW